MRHPRLAEHVLARRHVAGDREFVVLHDQRSHEALELAPATWAVLQCADGTRDAEGISAAASRMGAKVSVDSVRELLEKLRAKSMLSVGAPSHDPECSTATQRDTELLAQRVEALPHFALRCTGAGSCCKQYGSVLFTHDDMLRARATLPDFQVGPVPIRRMFLPREGSAPTPVHVPTLKDGACGFLAADGLCEIHRAGGSDAKPHACSAFPMRYCSDGEAIRVSPCTECLCVLASGAEPSRVPMLDSGVVRGTDVDRFAVVEQLPATIVLHGTCTTTPAALRAWSHSVCTGAVPEDPARWIWSQAEAACATGRLDPAAPLVAPSRARVRGMLDELGRELDRLSDRTRGWHAPGQNTSLSLARLRAGLKLLRAPIVLDALLDALLEHTAIEAPHEWFYLRANLWGYLDLAQPSVVVRLRDRALRLWLARAVDTLLVQAPEGLALANIDALMRGLGLRNYVEQLVE